jgi:hypothetical protein
MVARLIARLPAVVAGKTYEDDPHSFRSLKKSGTIAAREPELPGDAAQNPLLVYVYKALALELEQEHKEVMLLALATETVDLEKEPEPTTILPALGGGGGANCLIGVAMLTKASQQQMKRGCVNFAEIL